MDLNRLAQLTWWLLVLVVAVSASGLIQYAKGWFKRAPSWAWGLLLPALCLAIAAAFEPWPWLLLLALLGMVIAQLGYDTIIKGLLAWVARIGGPEIPPPLPGPPT